MAIALLFSHNTHAQQSDYSISSFAEEGFLAPNTHYLGEAWLHFSMPADSLTGYGITKEMFKANSTLNWHKHSSAQVLIIIDGVGYYQERGKEPVLMKEGDIIKCPPGIEH
jgi:quercetin dioxygenase-like cupin family protein